MRRIATTSFALLFLLGWIACGDDTDDDTHPGDDDSGAGDDDTTVGDDDSAVGDDDDSGAGDDDDSAAGDDDDSAEEPGFVPAPLGCSMAHCDGRMSDQIGLLPPLPPTPDVTVAERLWWDSAALAGSGYGLGCVSNGEAAACTYCGIGGGDNLVVYDADGTRRWVGDLADDACYSAAMIDAAGGVIAADSQQLVRYDPQGNELWNTPLFGDLPISPVLTENGIVVVAVYRYPGSTAESSIYAFDSRDGSLVGLLEDPALSSFDTANTPCVRGNRVYVSLKDEDAGVARLQAVDVDPAAPEPLTAGPAFEGFEPPQGASPLCVDDRIYFDGAVGEQVFVFGVQDQGDELALLWSREMGARVEASLSHDPRGGVWGWAIAHRHLHRWDEMTGEELDLIDVNALIGDPDDIHSPSSAQSIAGDASMPVMMVMAKPLISGDTYVVAIDLIQETLLWRYDFAVQPSVFTAPQYVIVEGDEGPVVVFPTYYGGARGVGFP